MTRYDYGVGEIQYVRIDPNPVNKDGTTTVTVRIKNVGTGWSYFNVGVYVSGQDPRYGETDGLYVNEEKTYTFDISGIFEVKGITIICWMFNYDDYEWKNHDQRDDILYPYTEEEVPVEEGFDVLGWIWNGILGLFEGALNLVSGSFISFLNKVKAILDTFATDIVNFFSDPIGHVRDYVETTWTWINDIAGKIAGVIGEWWNDTSKTVQSWINSAIANIQDFIEDPIGYLNNWWQTVSKTVQSWINDAVSTLKNWMETTIRDLRSYAETAINGINTWIEDFPKNVQNWWNSTLKAVFDTVKSAAETAVSWIDTAYTNISDWLGSVLETVGNMISNAIQSSLSWVTDGLKSFSAWIQGINISIAEYIGNQILEVQKWVTNYFQESLMGMFGWIGDIKDNIVKLVGGFLDVVGYVLGIKEPEEKPPELENQIEDIRNKAKKMVGEE